MAAVGRITLRPLSSPHATPPGTAVTDIFLSYSSKDRERVRPIRDALAALGYDVFWDQEVPAGVNWNSWIMDHLSRARIVVVAWSKQSVVSDPVIHEATIAKEDKKLVPCLIEALATRDFPLGHYTTQAASLHDWTGQAAHKGYLDLMQAVRSRLEGGAGAVAAAAQADEAKDIAELRKRANAGDAAARVNLGYRYGRGDGVAKDEQEAVRLYKLAADQGNAGAQSNLGNMHADGRGGLKVDRDEAMRLWKLAAAGGSEAARTFLQSQNVAW